MPSSFTSKSLIWYLAAIRCSGKSGCEELGASMVVLYDTVFPPNVPFKFNCPVTPCWNHKKILFTSADKCYRSASLLFISQMWGYQEENKILMAWLVLDILMS